MPQYDKYDAECAAATAADFCADDALEKEEFHHPMKGDPVSQQGEVEVDECVVLPPRRSPLRWVQSIIYRVFPPGGILSSAFSLASGSIGAGILGLPGATDTAGLVMAMIYLVVIAFFSAFSMYLLAVVLDRTKARSFEDLGRALFPQWRYAFSYWVAFIRWFHAFGAGIGYTISVGNCLSPIFKEAHRRQPDNKVVSYFNTTPGNRLLVSLIWMCIMLPLVLPKHVDSLRYASMLAIAFMTYFVLTIIVHSCLNGLPAHRHNIRTSGSHFHDEPGPLIFLFRTGNPAIGAVGTFMFAFVLNINAVEVYWDFNKERRSVRNFTMASTLGTMICAVLYMMVSIFGYFDFGSEDLASNSILLMYNPLSEPQVMVAYVGVLVKLCVSYALLSIASRNAIYYVLGWHQKYACRRPHAGHREEGGNEMQAPAKGATLAPGAAGRRTPEEDALSDLDYHNLDQFVDNIPYWKHLIVVLCLAVVKLICGLFIPTINIVFGFAGAISGGFIAFIFPALFFIYSGQFSIRQCGWFRYVCTYLLLISGIVGLVFGTGSTIYNTVIGV
ncbi:amino acid permease [Strigomonas culicis]|uniref:Amino acid permease n=1 Tax=Strigomonas culicis TaxID=28005 RepID=S9UB24_9TRYP|nr:amino acid permease [Strigomonas culicis]|eukprot:EPY25949.1 amino acid permease [Strigomonas culicis]